MKIKLKSSPKDYVMHIIGRSNFQVQLWMLRAKQRGKGYHSFFSGIETIISKSNNQLIKKLSLNELYQFCFICLFFLFVFCRSLSNRLLLITTQYFIMTASIVSEGSVNSSLSTVDDFYFSTGHHYHSSRWLGPCRKLRSRPFSWTQVWTWWSPPAGRDWNGLPTWH